MKLFALIIAASAALAPLQAYASTGSDQSSVQPPMRVSPSPRSLGEGR